MSYSATTTELIQDPDASVKHHMVCTNTSYIYKIYGYRGTLVCMALWNELKYGPQRKETLVQVTHFGYGWKFTLPGMFLPDNKLVIQFHVAKSN